MLSRAVWFIVLQRQETAGVMMIRRILKWLMGLGVVTMVVVACAEGPVTVVRPVGPALILFYTDN